MGLLLEFPSKQRQVNYLKQMPSHDKFQLIKRRLTPRNPRRLYQGGPRYLEIPLILGDQLWRTSRKLLWLLRLIEYSDFEKTKMFIRVMDEFSQTKTNEDELISINAKAH